MKLYDWSIAPNPRRVRMYLAEKGIEVTTVQVAAPKSMGLDAAYLEKSSHRTVPMLELDDGTCIVEAMAICRYFEAHFKARHSEPPLFGRDACEQAVVEMWERQAEYQGLHAGAESFRNSHPAFEGRAVPGYPDPIAQIPELGERGRYRFNHFLQKMDARLAGVQFLAGDIFSVADITAFCGLDFVQKFRLPIPPELSHLQRWYAQIKVRPSAAATAT